MSFRLEYKTGGLVRGSLLLEWGREGAERLWTTNPNSEEDLSIIREGGIVPVEYVSKHNVDSGSKHLSPVLLSTYFYLFLPLLTSEKTPSEDVQKVVSRPLKVGI